MVLLIAVQRVEWLVLSYESLAYRLDFSLKSR